MSGEISVSDVTSSMEIGTGNSGDVKDPQTTSSIFPMMIDKATTILQTTDETLQEDKRRISSHPLYPLLEILLVKCEELTRKTKDVISTEQEIKQVIKDLGYQSKSLSSGDPELDSLMISGIRVLRIHLLELGKVNDLCKEFCNRYTACIKSRINQETLLGFTNDSDDEQSISFDHQTAMKNCESGVSNEKSTVATIQTAQGQISISMFKGATTNRNQPQTVSSSSESLLLPPYQSAIQSSVATTSGTTLKSLILPLVTEEQAQQFLAAAAANDDDSAYLDISDGESISSSEGSLGLKNLKRTSLPRKAVEQLRSWLFQHVMHPYPSENEKRQLSKTTGLNLIQVNNWFINARRRILQPMLEGHPGINSAPKTPTSTHSENQGSPCSTTAAVISSLPRGTATFNGFPSPATASSSSAQTATAAVSVVSSGVTPPPKRARPLQCHEALPVVTTTRENVTSLLANGIANEGVNRPLLTSAQRYWPLAGVGGNESAVISPSGVATNSNLPTLTKNKNFLSGTGVKIEKSD